MLPILLTSFALIACVSGENPAIQLVLTDKGLQTVRHFAAGVIQDKLDNYTFPDVNGQFLGIHYNLSGTRVNKCDFPEPSVHFSPNVSGLDLSLSGLSVSMSGDWATRLGVIHDGGTFDMAMFDLDIRSVLELGRDSNGHLSVSSVSCDAGIQSIDMDFHGGASWIFKMLVKMFIGKIKDRAERHICSCVKYAVVSLEQYLQAMNVSFDLNSVLSLELPLSDSPAVDSESMNFGLKGEFYSLETHKEPPFVAQPFTLPKQSNYMLSLGLSEYTVNSASFAYYISGHMHALINDSMVPRFCPVRLNTTSMGPYIPQLPKLFPNLLMSLQVYAQKVPHFSFEPDFVKLGLRTAVKAFAVQPNSTLTPLFKLNLASAFRGKMWIDSGKLKSSVTMDNFTLSLANTEIGPFKTDALENLAKNGLIAALGMINKKLGQGFDLPKTKNVQLVNSVLKVKKGFMALASDAKLQSTY